MPCSSAARTGRDRVLDGAGDVEQHVDVRARRHQHRVLGHRRAAGLDGAGEAWRAVDHRRVLEARRLVGGDGLRRRARGDGGDADRVAVGAAGLQHHARGHEARPDHADPDRRLARGDVPGDRGIDDDHGSLLCGISRPRRRSGSGRGTGGHRLRQVVAEPERELDDGVGGVLEAGGGEDARAADVEVGEPVHPAVPVDHPGRGIVAHPGGAHLVPPAQVLPVRRRRQDRLVGENEVVEAHPADVPLGEVGREGQGRVLDGAVVDLQGLPVQADALQAEGVPGLGQGDPALGVERLLAVDHDPAPGVLLRVAAGEVVLEAAPVALQRVAGHRLDEPLGEGQGALGAARELLGERQRLAAVVVEVQDDLQRPVLGEELLGGGEVPDLGVRDLAEDRLADLHSQVIAEIPAHQVVLVADAGRDLAGEVEQKPRVLEAAGAEAVAARPDGEAGIVGGVAAEDRALDAGQAVVEPEVDEVRMDAERDPLGVPDLVEILLAEPGRGAAQVPDLVEAVLRRDGDRRRDVAAIRDQVEDLGDLRRVGVEVGAADRPAAQGVLRPRPHVRRLEGAAEPVPVPGRAAEAAHARHVQIGIGEPHALADGDVLRLLGPFEAAALHQRDIEAAGGEPARQRDPRRAGADDADVEVAVEGRALGRLDVKDHRAFLPACTRPGGRAAGADRDRRAMPRWRSEGSGDGNLHSASRERSGHRLRTRAGWSTGKPVVRRRRAGQSIPGRPRPERGVFASCGSFLNR